MPIVNILLNLSPQQHLSRNNNKNSGLIGVAATVAGRGKFLS